MKANCWYTLEELKSNFKIVDNNLHRFNNITKTWTLFLSRDNHTAGRCRIHFKKHMVLFHRIFWELSNDRLLSPESLIDHIDGNPLNNSIENLRVVDKRGNICNQQMHREGKKPGYYFFKRDNCYRANITINKQNVHLGLFKTEEDAAAAYELALINITKYENREQFVKLIFSDNALSLKRVLKGRVLSAETRKKLSANKVKPFKCLENGKVYNSLEEAGRDLNMSPSYPSKVLKGVYKHAKGYTFSYVE